MNKARLYIKNSELREEFKYKRRKDLKKDFFELLKRASKTTDLHH
jgi:hypothetical protein